MWSFVKRPVLRAVAGIAVTVLAATGGTSGSGFAVAPTAAPYPNSQCTIPPDDYYDFYDDCAAYTSWGTYVPDGAINSGPWSVELPTALGDTISALSYDGEPYVQGIAHGTEMGFNFHEGTADCYNPTEPGMWDDDITAKWGAGWNQHPWLGPSTTAVLAAPGYPSATSVATRARLAMWLSNGEKDQYCTGGAHYPNMSPYTYQLSPYVLAKTVGVGPLPELPGVANVMRVDGDLTVESTTGGTSPDGVFVTYLRCDFTSWYELPAHSEDVVPEPGPGDPPSDTHLVSARESTSGQDVDVLIAATPDGARAFALYSPEALNAAAPAGEQEYQYLQDSPAGCGFGKQLSDQITFPLGQQATRQPGSYRYRIYAAVGSLDQVESAVRAMRDTLT